MPEYRITIGTKAGSEGRPTRSPSKLEVLKATLVGILGLATVIGVVLAAFVVGSILASVLLILLAFALLVWGLRRILGKFKRIV